MIGLFQEDPLAFGLLLAVLVLSLTLHEYAHAYAALRFGDRTALLEGRLTLNPLRHLDPLGSILLLFLGFGWARPVPVNPYALRPYRLGFFTVAIAGILVNLFLAVLFALALRGLFSLDPMGVVLGLRGEGGGGGGVLALALLYAASINLVLALFNLLPIPPLDGAKILQSLLPLAWHPFLYRLEAYSWLSFILIFVVLREPIQAALRSARRAFFDLFF